MTELSEASLEVRLFAYWESTENHNALEYMNRVPGERQMYEHLARFVETLIAERTEVQAREIARLREVLTECVDQMEHDLVQIENEWGQCQTLSEMYASGDVPKTLIAARAALAAEPPE